MAIDTPDNLPIDEVGGWALEKHERLRKYIDASRALAENSCLLVARVERVTSICIAALVKRSSVIQVSPSTEVLLSRSNALANRIAREGSATNQHAGEASEAVKSVVEFLNPSGLHFAFLDPYNLQDLPFSVIETLARFQRMDMLIHVSAQDLQRNLDRYTREGDTRREVFAPGWRNSVNLNQSQNSVRASLLNYWLDKIKKLGVAPAQGIALVSGEKNQRLYWLVFVSRSDFAARLWEDIRGSGQRTLL